MTDGPYNQKEEVPLCKRRKQAVSFTPNVTNTYQLLRLHDMETASKPDSSAQYNYSIKANTFIRSTCMRLGMRRKGRLVFHSEC